MSDCVVQKVEQGADHEVCIYHDAQERVGFNELKLHLVLLSQWLCLLDSVVEQVAEQTAGEVQGHFLGLAVDDEAVHHVHKPLCALSDLLCTSLYLGHVADGQLQQSLFESHDGGNGRAHVMRQELKCLFALYLMSLIGRDVVECDEFEFVRFGALNF